MTAIPYLVYDNSGALVIGDKLRVYLKFQLFVFPLFVAYIATFFCNPSQPVNLVLLVPIPVVVGIWSALRVTSTH